MGGDHYRLVQVFHCHRECQPDADFPYSSLHGGDVE